MSHHGRQAINMRTIKAGLRADRSNWRSQDQIASYLKREVKGHYKLQV